MTVNSVKYFTFVLKETAKKKIRILWAHSVRPVCHLLCATIASIVSVKTYLLGQRCTPCRWCGASWRLCDSFLSPSTNDRLTYATSITLLIRYNRLFGFLSIMISVSILVFEHFKPETFLSRLRPTWVTTRDRDKSLEVRKFIPEYDEKAKHGCG